MDSLAVNVGLPKTGTSFLGGLLRQIDCISVSSIKEPTYLASIETDYSSTSQSMKNIIAHSNNLKGDRWYLSLFDQSKAVGVDLSTQYWGQNIISDDVGDILIRKFCIVRPAEEQLLSYVSHLRRGYLKDSPLEELLNQDPEFFRYLQNMARFIKDAKHLEAEGVKIFHFKALTKTPDRFLRDFMTWLLGDPEFKLNNINYEVKRNAAATPRSIAINRVLMNSVVRSSLRAITPTKLYAPLLRLRKTVINANLTTAGISENNQRKLDLEVIQEILLNEA